MAQIIKDITVDVARKNLFQAIVAKQNDCNSRFLKVTLVNEGTKIDIPATATAVINAERANGTSHAYMGTINDDGTVTVPLTTWMLALDDFVRCSISIFSADEQKLSSTSFSIEVESAEYFGEDISEDENYDILVRLISDVTETKTACEEATSNAEAAAIAATSAAEEAKEISDYYGSPLVAPTASAMTRTNRVYVYTGSEVGYTKGNWYYYNNGVWESGGAYNSADHDVPGGGYEGDYLGISNEGTPTWKTIDATEISEFEYGTVQDAIGALIDTDYYLSESKAERTALDAVREDGERTARSLRALWELSRGQTWDFETIETTAYAPTVPTGAKLATVTAIGGANAADGGVLLSAKVNRISFRDRDAHETAGIDLSALLTLDGYGLGIDAQDCNKVDLLNKKYIQKVVIKTFDGSADEEWAIRTDGNTYFGAKLGANGSVVANKGVCNSMQITSISASNQNIGFNIINSSAYSGAFINVRPEGFASMTVAVFRAYLAANPLTVVYALASAEETDISDIVSDIDSTSVEVGGSIAFIQEDGTEIAVPNTIEYVVKLDEVN